MVLRGELQARCRSSSLSSRSGPYGEVRNILFVAGQGRSAHWLLPDNGHVITEQRDIAADDSEQSGKVPVATVVLVKPAHEDLETAEGKLFLLAPSGGNVQTVATGVRQLHTAAVQGATLILFFKHQRKYVIAVFDVPSLTKKNQRELEIPQLK